MIEPYLTFANILIISGLGLVILELFIGVEAGFDLVLLGTILVISGVANLFGLNIPYTLLLTAVLTVIYIAVGRKTVRRKLTVATSKTNIDNLIGRTAVTLSPIEPHKAGRIRSGDEQWRAISRHNIGKNEQVTIVSVEGVSAVVEKI